MRKKKQFSRKNNTKIKYLGKQKTCLQRNTKQAHVIIGEK